MPMRKREFVQSVEGNYKGGRIKVGNVYVPLEYSDVMKFVPEGEEIIYSTLCKVEVWDLNYFSASSNKSKTYKYEAHVVMTNKGLAFHIPPQIIYDKSILNTQEVPDGIYLSWHFVHGFGRPKKMERVHFGRIDIEKKGWKPKKSGCVSFGFKLVPHANYESKEAFKVRVKEFQSVMSPIWLDVSAEFLKKLYIIFDNNPNISYDDYKKQFDFFGDKLCFNTKKYSWEHGRSVLDDLQRCISK